MKSVIGRSYAARAVSLAVMAAVLAGSAGAALGQDTLAESRLRKMEAEIKALQRKVFPGGDDRYFQPEITSGTAAAGAPPPPSSSAVTDILTRMDALEAQIARLTGQVEQNSNRIAQLEKHAGIAAPADPSATSTPAQEAVSTPAPASAPAPQSNLDAMTSGASAAKPAPAPAAAPAPPPTAAPAASAAPTDRVRAVSAIVKPQTDDAGDDEYSYGFRLWDAGYYPEAQQQLKIFVDKYPRHARTSWGRNLLGRAYLDGGNPREAAKWFLQNYQADKAGARAPDSLLYLAVSMKQLKDTKRACIALSEFSETFAAEAAGRLKGLYDATRNGLNCGG